jgi:hypothetical protein
MRAIEFYARGIIVGVYVTAAVRATEGHAYWNASVIGLQGL